MIILFTTMISCSKEIIERAITPGFVTHEIEGDRLNMVIHSDDEFVTLRHTLEDAVFDEDVHKSFFTCLSIGIRSGSVVEVWDSKSYWSLEI